jgi:hypothetical protein
VVVENETTRQNLHGCMTVCLHACTYIYMHACTYIYMHAHVGRYACMHE